MLFEILPVCTWQNSHVGGNLLYNSTQTHLLTSGRTNQLSVQTLIHLFIQLSRTHKHREGGWIHGCS